MGYCTLDCPERHRMCGASERIHHIGGRERRDLPRNHSTIPIAMLRQYHAGENLNRPVVQLADDRSQVVTPWPPRPIKHLVGDLAPQGGAELTMRQVVLSRLSTIAGALPARTDSRTHQNEVASESKLCNGRRERRLRHPQSRGQAVAQQQQGWGWGWGWGPLKRPVCICP